MEYEINFLVLQSKTEDLEKIKEQLKKMIVSHGGSLTDELEYKKRKLAYQIKHELYGFFTVYRFKIEGGDNIESLKNDLNLFSDVARYMIVRTNEVPLLKKITDEKAKEEQEKVIKQEDVEKLLAKKEEETKKAATPSPQKATEKPAAEEEVVSKKEPAPAKETEAKEEQPEEKKEQEAKKDSEEKKKEEKKNTLEDLDKKLDEILNI